MSPPFNLFCSRLNKLRDLSCYSYVLSSGHFTIFVQLLLTLLNSVMFFRCCGAQNSTQNCSRWSHTGQSTGGIIPSSLGWQCWAWCTPGYGWPFWMPGHATDICSTNILTYVVIKSLHTSVILDEFVLIWALSIEISWYEISVCTLDLLKNSHPWGF